MTVSLAYFLYDLVCCLVIDPRDVVGTMHHLCTMAGFVVGLGQSKARSGPPPKKLPANPPLSAARSWSPACFLWR